MHIKKAKLSKKQSKSLRKLQKRKQTKKRSPLHGGASSCEAAYVTEPGFSIPDNGVIKGFMLPSKRALISSSRVGSGASCSGQQHP